MSVANKESQHSVGLLSHFPPTVLPFTGDNYYEDLLFTEMALFGLFVDVARCIVRIVD